MRKEIRKKRKDIKNMKRKENKRHKSLNDFQGPETCFETGG